MIGNPPLSLLFRVLGGGTGQLKECLQRGPSPLSFRVRRKLRGEGVVVLVQPHQRHGQVGIGDTPRWKQGLIPGWNQSIRDAD